MKYAYFDFVDVPGGGGRGGRMGGEWTRRKIRGASGSGTSKGGEGNVEGERGGRRRVGKVEDENRIHLTLNASGWRAFHAGQPSMSFAV